HWHAPRMNRSSKEEDNDDENRRARRFPRGGCAPGGGGGRPGGVRDHAGHSGRARPAKESHRRLGGGTRRRAGRGGKERKGPVVRNGQPQVEGPSAERSRGHS